MSGNAAILRGGSEAIETSRAINAALVDGIKAAGLPEAAIQLIPTTHRAAVGAMLTAAGLIAIIVPRGGKSLVARAIDGAQGREGVYMYGALPGGVEHITQKQKN